MERGHLSPPDEIDMVAAQKAIRKAGVVGIAALAVAVPAGYLLFPQVLHLPDALPDRLAFAAQASVFVLLCVIVGIGLVSTTRRSSPADIGGSAAGPPSEKVAIYAAYLQNTLEQAVIAVGLYFALATLLVGAWLSLIPVGVGFFLVGRMLFLRGYARGAQGRALGMVLTMMPTLIGYVLVVGLIVGRAW